MKYIEAPDEYDVPFPTNEAVWSEIPKEKSVFLAGGISGTKDWQQELVAKLASTNLVLINPRRKTGLEKTGDAARKQIEWEHKHIEKATAVSFWFPPETLCPIVLFELGKCLGNSKKIFVGCDPQYQRKFDVMVQVALEMSNVVVVDSLDLLAEQILAWEKRT